ncbi:MAG: glutamate--tRNA ligase [Pseudomonadota bacterium]
MTVTTRFAPSPTGVLHIGGVRTALFCYLYARRHDGQFVLRIEDTDRERSTQASVDAILDGMAWLGLDADVGPIYQTARFDRYQAVLDEWLASGTAYYCYCTREELDERREAQKAAGEKPRYDGRCRSRTEPRAGVSPVVRFRNPDDGQVVINDAVRGRVVIANSELDDLIIARSDGTPTYNFTVVIDDADMNITHVIRGDDHLNNTPRQINMLDALGARPPHYAHVPMILGEDGARLSKRHGAVNVLDYREQGYLPEALLNYLVRLGWSHGDQELFSREEMIALFDIDDVNASASTFNPEKLAWINQQYILTGDAERLADVLAEQLGVLGIDATNGPALVDVVDAYRERAVTLRAMAEDCAYLFADEISIDEKAAKKNLRPVVLEPMQALRNALSALADWQPEALGKTVSDVAEQAGINMGKLGQPTRVAVTGKPASPGLDATLFLVGRERTLARLEVAISHIEQRAAQQQ